MKFILDLVLRVLLVPILQDIYKKYARKHKLGEDLKNADEHNKIHSPDSFDKLP